MFQIPKSLDDQLLKVLNLVMVKGFVFLKFPFYVGIEITDLF